MIQSAVTTEVNEIKVKKKTSLTGVSNRPKYSSMEKMTYAEESIETEIIPPLRSMLI